MAAGDFKFGENDNGIENVSYRENPTKTSQGGLHITRRQQLPKNVCYWRQKMPGFHVQRISQPSSRISAKKWAILSVTTVKNYPKQPRLVQNAKAWCPLIDKIIKTMIVDIPLTSSSKRKTNLSARITLQKKMRLNNVERSSIMNVTGHRNEQSLNDCHEGNENEHRHFSNRIGSSKLVNPVGKRKPMSMNMMSIVPPSTQKPSTSYGFERLGFSNVMSFSMLAKVNPAHFPKSKSAVTSK